MPVNTVVGVIDETAATPSQRRAGLRARPLRRQAGTARHARAAISTYRTATRTCRPFRLRT